MGHCLIMIWGDLLDTYPNFCHMGTHRSRFLKKIIHIYIYIVIVILTTGLKAILRWSRLGTDNLRMYYIVTICYNSYSS